MTCINTDELIAFLRSQIEMCQVVDYPWKRAFENLIEGIEKGMYTRECLAPCPVKELAEMLEHLDGV